MRANALLDVDFYDHPRFVQAGFAATGLWSCALAFCKKYDTAGMISKDATFLQRAGAKALAAKLCEVGLWQENEDGYELLKFNRKQGGEPPKKKREGSQAPKSTDFLDDLEAWCQQWAIPMKHPEFAKFLDYHRARATVFKDWAAAWRTWLRNAKAFAPPPQPLMSPPRALFPRKDSA